MLIGEYFNSLEKSLVKNRKIGFLERPVFSKEIDDYNGLFKGRVFFWDGSRLTIEEAISTERGYPEILRYSYTYTRTGQHIFRYDNAPHHPGLPTFPHHKHIGPDETATPAEKPSLSQVFVEIREHLIGE